MPIISPPSTYRINEIFYSLQGEGRRTGQASVFVRFAKCNLECQMAPGDRSPGGFDCDTEFESGRTLTLPEIAAAIQAESPKCKWLVLTGGEPALQLDIEFCRYFRQAGYALAIETNGTLPLLNLHSAKGAKPLDPQNWLDWITVSPKTAEHTLKQLVAHELRYVRAYGQALPEPRVRATHKYLSPAFGSGGRPEPRAVEWCVNLCLENPNWTLSVQDHKLWNLR